MVKVKFTIITLFPEAIKPYLDASMMWKAQEKGIVEFELVNLRDYGLGAHKSVDDTPYGGGDGMLLRCEPVFAAVEEVKRNSPEAKVILPTPVGEVLDQELVRQLAGKGADEIADAPSRAPGRQPVVTGDDPIVRSRCRVDPSIGASDKPRPHFIIVCPHYEGYDERIMSIVDLPISVGKYVLTGGELPALVIVDSIVRLLPGVLGGEKSAEIESFSDGDNLEYPQYTKPAEFQGMKVPEVLLSGHHGKIDAWRAEQAQKRQN